MVTIDEGQDLVGLGIDSTKMEWLYYQIIGKLIFDSFSSTQFHQKKIPLFKPDSTTLNLDLVGARFIEYYWRTNNIYTPDDLIKNGLIVE